MRLALLLFTLALVAAGCTISIKPIPPQKKKVVYRTHRHHRTVVREVEAAEAATPAPRTEPLRNLKPQNGYRLMSPTPNPEYNP